VVFGDATGDVGVEGFRFGAIADQQDAFACCLAGARVVTAAGGQAEERQDQAEAGQCGEKSHSGNAVRGWTDCMEKISSNPRFLDYNFSVRLRA
jgi:hypothetical protein